MVTFYTNRHFLDGQLPSPDIQQLPKNQAPQKQKGETQVSGADAPVVPFRRSCSSLVGSGLPYQEGLLWVCKKVSQSHGQIISASEVGAAPGGSWPKELRSSWGWVSIQD